MLMCGPVSRVDGTCCLLRYSWLVMCITSCTDDDDDFVHKLCWSWGSEKLNVPCTRRGSVTYDMNCSVCT